MFYPGTYEQLLYSAILQQQPPLPAPTLSAPFISLLPQGPNASNDPSDPIIQTYKSLCNTIYPEGLDKITHTNMEEASPRVKACLACKKGGDGKQQFL